jgi:hypothetical protein
VSSSQPQLPGGCKRSSHPYRPSGSAHTTLDGSGMSSSQDLTLLASISLGVPQSRKIRHRCDPLLPGLVAHNVSPSHLPLQRSVMRSGTSTILRISTVQTPKPTSGRWLNPDHYQSMIRPAPPHPFTLLTSVRSTCRSLKQDCARLDCMAAQKPLLIFSYVVRSSQPARATHRPPCLNNQQQALNNTQSTPSLILAVGLLKMLEFIATVTVLSL